MSKTSNATKASKPSKSNQDSDANAAAKLPALPPRRKRRRSVRASHSWCFRRPPSHRRVKATQARALPERIAAPEIIPLTDAWQ